MSSATFFIAARFVLPIDSGAAHDFDTILTALPSAAGVARRLRPARCCARLRLEVGSSGNDCPDPMEFVKSAGGDIISSR
jgi:hypothetical protein